MIAIKGGTQTWSTSEQQSSLKGDGRQTMSATDRQDILGDKDLGEHLNKIADPNWVDPAKLRQVGNSDLDKDSFMKLFLAQLKNQDPMNPMQSHEMAAQLAQFTSLEKLTNIDEGIGGMNKAQDMPQSFEALNLIGKRVAGDSAKIIRHDEKEQHDIEFDLKGEAKQAILTVKDWQGYEVKKLEVGGLKKGKNSVPWNGRMENGTLAQPGEYKITIEARDSFNKKVYAETAFEGNVTGVEFTARGPVLKVGNKKIRMNEVKSITQPQNSEEGKKSSVGGTGGGVNAAQVVKELETQDQQGGQVAGMGGNLENIGMSQGLINKLEGQNE